MPKPSVQKADRLIPKRVSLSGDEGAHRTRKSQRQPTQHAKSIWVVSHFKGPAPRNPKREGRRP